MTDARLLADALARPAEARLDADGWTALLTMARAEQLLGTLAHRLHGLEVPDEVGRILADARAGAEQARRSALWEAEMARRALAPLGVPVVLLKGTAFAAAGLAAGQGRAIGDLDILVPRAALTQVEAALLGTGWEWVKPDPYDDAYYRRWMHELPPLIHVERDRMIDVHHTILPPTARPTPDAAALIADAVPLGNGVSVLSPADMIVHAAAHLFADGDLAGGLRNLWDVHCLVEEFGSGPVPPPSPRTCSGGHPSADTPGAALAAPWTPEQVRGDDLQGRAALHGLRHEVARALRLSRRLFGTEVPDWAGQDRATDALYLRRLLARDGWGRPTRTATRAGFYVRSHWLRMPPALLARHLWIKWRRGGRA